MIVSMSIEQSTLKITAIVQVHESHPVVRACRANNIGDTEVRQVLVAHALTGCDTTSEVGAK